MKRGVITVLGAISCWNNETKKYDVNKKAEYKVDEKLQNIFSFKKKKYTNMLPLLIENFSSNYELVPIYTLKAKDIQTNVLEKCENLKIDIEKLFERGVLIENENDFKSILKDIDKKIKEYDEVIIDVSHGFRHFPILMTIDLIITSLKNDSVNKIKHILFAEEIQPMHYYKIIDLKEYLELANLAVIFNIFKENYSISNHIKIKNKEYVEILNLMKKFSKDLMALSIDNLLFKVVPTLKKDLKDLLEKDFILFQDEINNILRLLDDIYTPKNHRYQTFYYIADDVSKDEKGYLAVAISLIFEGVSFYFYTQFKKSPKLKEFFEKLKKDNLNDYDILNLCRGVIDRNKDDLIVSKKIAKYFNDEIKNEFYKKKEEILKPFYRGKYNHLLSLFYKSRKLRNNLLHANSGERVEKVHKEVRNLIKAYKRTLIKGKK